MITKVDTSILDDNKKVTWPDLEQFYSGNYYGLVEIMYSDEALSYASKWQYKLGIVRRVWNLRRKLVNPFTDKAFIKSLVKAGTITLR